jgi:hypothetical protein
MLTEYMSNIGRNRPCPCGSGRKYKKCCGSPSTQAPAPLGQVPPFTINICTFQELPGEVQQSVLQQQAQDAEKAAARVRRYGHVRARSLLMA